jgi:hypothetical protein
LAALLGLVGALAACRSGERRVDALDYDTFFVWPGMESSPALARASTVYLLAGEVRGDDNARIVLLRPALPRAARARLWLVVRTDRLDWQPAVTAQLLAELDRWKRAGNRVEGVQIDFAAATRGLAGYARFLGSLRRALPADCRLSITGLMDWSANADAAGLAALADVVDEAVIQTYQGRATVPGYEGYLRALRRLSMPYRIGLVEGGGWRAPAGLNSDPDFRGYVVFLTQRP